MLNHVSHGDPGSPAVLLLHGFMGSAADWDLIAGTLSKDFVCVALDLPGHGESTDIPDEAYTMPGAARAVVGEMDSLGLLQAAVAGYSMGGRLALFLALRHPERCAGLILESASPGIEDEEERASRRETDEGRARRLESGDFKAFLRDWYAQALFSSLASHEGMVDGLIETRRDNDLAELAKSLRGMGTGNQPSLWRELSGLRVPALAVAGEMDEKFSDISRRMAGSSPKLRYELVPGAGHIVHAEKPGAYLASLRNLLDRATFRAG